MATVLPFNQIKVGSTVVAGPDDFIYGTGRCSLKGDDNAVTTADGKIHNYRSSLHPEASVEVRGDKRAKATGQTEKWPTASGPIELGLVASRGGTATAVHTFDGIISVEYDGENNKSTLNISGCDTP
jgi:hypothetical protein